MSRKGDRVTETAGSHDGAGMPANPLSDRRTLTQRMSREIAKGILSGGFTTGNRLPSEAELTRLYDVSRPVVREAVKQLAALGLVRTHQGRGTTVAPPADWQEFSPELLAVRIELGDIDDLLLELLEIRRMVETEAAGLAAQRATAADLAVIGGNLAQMDERLDDLELFTKGDVAFHQAILEATRNRLVGTFFGPFQELFREARTLSLRTRPGGARESQRGHRAIFNAIRQEAPAAARRAMAEHLSWTANLELGDLERRLRNRSPLRTPGIRA
jgi:DNA-binding FadR family transcriptional regulator